MKKSYYLFMPYSKQGDDLEEHRKGGATSQVAFAAYAAQLRIAAQIAEALAAEADVEITDSVCNMILLEMEDSIYERLVETTPLEECEDDDEAMEKAFEAAHTELEAGTLQTEDE